MRIEIDFDQKINITEEVKKEITKALWEVGLDLKGECAAGTPVDTGNLKNSYNLEVRDGEAIVTNSANYSAYVEFGDLRGKKPRRSGRIPFMRPALYENADKYVKHFAQIVKDNL